VERGVPFKTGLDDERSKIGAAKGTRTWPAKRPCRDSLFQTDGSTADATSDFIAITLLVASRKPPPCQDRQHSAESLPR